VNESPPETERARLADEPENPKKKTQENSLSQPDKQWLKSLSASINQDRDKLLQLSLQYPLDCENLVRAAAKLNSARDFIDDLLLPVRKRRKQ